MACTSVAAASSAALVSICPTTACTMRLLMISEASENSGNGGRGFATARHCDTAGYQRYFSCNAASFSTALRDGMASAAAPCWFSSRNALASRRNSMSLSFAVKREMQ